MCSSLFPHPLFPNINYFWESVQSAFIVSGRTHNAGRTLYVTTCPSTIASSRSRGVRTVQEREVTGHFIPARETCLKMEASYVDEKDSNFTNKGNPLTNKYMSLVKVLYLHELNELGESSIST